MSEIKKGDRVKVENMGTVCVEGAGQVFVRFDDESARWILRTDCTVIPTPYVPQVGDLVRAKGSGTIGEIDSIERGCPTAFRIVDSSTGSGKSCTWLAAEVELLARPGEVYLPKEDS